MKMYIKNILEKHSNNKFLKSILAILGGSALAQIITMASAPVITRMYDPHAFGLQSVFISAIGIITAIAALSYPLAIVQAEDDSEAIRLAKLSLIIVAINSIIPIGIFIYSQYVNNKWLKNFDLYDYIIFIPIWMFIYTASTISGQWLARKNAFYLTAKILVIQSVMTNGLKIGFGTYNPTADALIYANLIGIIAGILFGIIKSKNDMNILSAFKRNQKAAIIPFGLLYKYKDFAQYRAPQILLNVTSQGLPVLMLALYFGPIKAGLYSLAYLVVVMPTNVLGNSMAQVFYPKITEMVNEKKSVHIVLRRAMFALAAAGIIPLLILVIAAPILFAYIFGENWADSGIYAQWLAIWVFFQLINKPAIAAIPVLKLQRVLLIYEITCIILKCLALYIGYLLFKSDVIAIAIFSVVSAGSYLWLTLQVLNASKLNIQHA